MEEPRFAVLDIVEIVDAGQRGIVTEIRRWDDGRYTYSLGTFDEGSEIGGIYPEEWLRPTGEKAPLDSFQMPEPFMHRENVKITDDYEEREAAGRTGVLDWWSEDPHTGGVQLIVWIEELGEIFLVDPSQCVGTGERQPPKPRGRVSRNTATGPDGEPTDWYVVVDEIEQYL